MLILIGSGEVSVYVKLTTVNQQPSYLSVYLTVYLAVYLTVYLTVYRTGDLTVDLPVWSTMVCLHSDKRDIWSFNRVG
jgi:hypothetical protein